MSILKTLNKKANISMMAAAIGIPASLACAQFQVEHSAKDEPATVTTKESTITVFTRNADDHTYEIKIVDGEITIAKLDGKEFDKNRVRFDGESFIFVDENGKSIYGIKIPNTQKNDNFIQNMHIWKTKQNDGIVKTGESSVAINLFPRPKGGENSNLVVKGQWNPPKVMLGINLDKPSKVLRKHLRLKDDVHAILVEKVIEGLPAALAGLEEYDVIVSIDGSEQADGEMLAKILSKKEPGDTMNLVVLRGGKEIKFKIELAQYDPQALGVFSSDWNATMMSDQDGEMLDFLTEFEDAEFREKIRQQISKSKQQRELVRQMRAKAVDAMRNAERQMIEFRDGKLIVRSAQDIEEWMDEFFKSDVHNNDAAHFVSEDLYEALEDRLEAIEDRLDRQIDELGGQMDRLAEMFERMMDVLEGKDE